MQFLKELLFWITTALVLATGGALFLITKVDQAFEPEGWMVQP